MGPSEAIHVSPFAAPLFENAEGTRSYNPLDLIPSPPQFSLRRLALYFSAPSLEGEFAPECPWVGVKRLRPEPRASGVATLSSELFDRFRSSVRECLVDKERVLVSFSGGLDSLAALYHADLECSDRELLVAVTCLDDDVGGNSARTAARLLDAMNIARPLKVLSGCPVSLKEPDWDPAGPRTDAMPRYNWQMSDFAQQQGAEAILTGTGSDELFMATRFLTGRLLRDFRCRDIFYYWYDSLRYFGPLFAAGECLSVLSRVFSHRKSFKYYQSLSWPAICNLAPSPVLTDKYMCHVKEWSLQWLLERFKRFPSYSDWADAEAWDGLYPIDAITPAGSIPLLTPFLNESFVEFAMRLPLHQRYSSAGLTPYQRHKILVAKELLRPYPFKMLPFYKQGYGNALRRYWQSVFPDNGGLLADLGVIQRLSHQEYFEDCRVPRLIYSLHHWINGAIRAGGVPAESRAPDVGYVGGAGEDSN
ncbi:asparagine synthase-related protein [Rubinisphaera margarita]|uniref:asparagine synthase-related protein n=1 Tax=Rubinisphaera margarita TaxID=2909586 RepID=UPI001EE79649|nr:asparagine synthase-related protein [Rubinisphaera margarita]MCG6154632.1 asparagine synthase-related protein [Rubinisphaera margarita]